MVFNYPFKYILCGLLKTTKKYKNSINAKFIRYDILRLNMLILNSCESEVEYFVLKNIMHQLILTIDS